MDDRLKYYYDIFKSLMTDSWSESQILEQATLMADKEKTIKTGDNVLHIDYLSGLLTNDDLQEIESQLKAIGLELSSYDKSGVPYNSLEELTGIVRQILSSNVTHDILIGALGSAVWAGLSKIWATTYKKLKGQKINYSSSGGNVTTKDVTMSIVLHINETTSVEYNLRGDFQNDDEALETFNKILENVKNIPLNENPRRPYVAEANFDKKSVEIIDEEKFFQDQIAKQRKTKKKSPKGKKKKK